MRRLPSLAIPCLLGLLGLLGCGTRPPPEAVVTTAPSAGPAAQVVNATILANGCQDFGRANGRLAESAMYQLVEGCTTVPGGASQFAATLLPGGRIEIAAVPGGPDVLPICVLKHALTHKVALAKPCRLEVKIEQTSMTVAFDAGAGG